MNNYERQKRANDGMNPAKPLTKATEGSVIVISAKRYEITKVGLDGDVWARKIDRMPGESTHAQYIAKEYLQASGYEAKNT